MTNLEKDIEQCRANKVNVVEYVKKNGVDTLSYFCSTTQFSLLVAYSYIKEDFPIYEEECDRKLKLLKEFYGY